MNLKNLSNNDLYRQWTGFLEAHAADPEDRKSKRQMDACENEIIRRMQEASNHPVLGIGQ